MKTKTHLPLDSIGSIRSAIASGATTATAVSEKCLARITEEDERIHAFLSVDRKRALAQAARIDDLRSQGAQLPKLAGVPVGIKDVLTLKGMPATAGSRILEGYQGSSTPAAAHARSSARSPRRPTKAKRNYVGKAMRVQCILGPAALRSQMPLPWQAS